MFNLAINNINSFSSFKSYALSIPNLEDSEELQLFKDFKTNNCIKCAQKIILSHLKMVFKIAYEFNGYGFAEEELTQEGIVGLMKAVKNFNYNNGNRLYSYALVWVKAEIQNYILNNYKLVKLATTKNLKKLFFSYKKNKKELLKNGINESEIPKLISKNLNVEISDVLKAEEYFYNTEISIDEEKESGDSDNKKQFDLISYETPEDILIKNENELLIEKVKLALNNLNERERLVIKSRFFVEKKLTHKDLSLILNISSERVRQIEESAIKKLKKQF